MTRTEAQANEALMHAAQQRAAIAKALAPSPRRVRSQVKRKARGVLGFIFGR